MNEWQFPVGVDGWLSRNEGVLLSQYAKDKVVLEIGSYCGLSTICMAQTAKLVHAVDPFDGRGLAGPRNTYDEFQSNTVRYGVNNRIVAYVGTSMDAKRVRFDADFAFIDGAHDATSVCTDTEVALRHLSPDGLLAFHDYRDTPAENGRFDPGVTDAVNSLLRAGSDIVAQVGTVVVVTRPDYNKWQDERKPHVLVALPSRPGDQIAAGLFMATHNMGAGLSSRLTVQHCSLLTTNFNVLWCAALNDRPQTTHFCMCHADVVPRDLAWLAILVAELRKTKADILSVCIPIKDESGTTSTAVMNQATREIRKLSMAEVLKLPRSFTAEEAGYPGHTLLVNTGLWVCRMNTAWTHKMCFRQLDAIAEKEDGDFEAVCMPEDWLFSLDAHRLGLKVMATKCLSVEHIGTSSYPNTVAWGSGVAKDGVKTAWNIDAPESWGLPPESKFCGGRHERP